MASLLERVTVTMPAELVAGVDRYERNRSRFITEAVRHELKRRRHLELLLSLDEPQAGGLGWGAAHRRQRSARPHRRRYGEVSPEELEAIDAGLCLYLGLEPEP